MQYIIAAFVLGPVLGACVCVFGIWCFIRGQQNMREVIIGEIPQQIRTPVKAVADEVTQIKTESDMPDSIESLTDMLRVKDKIDDDVPVFESKI